MLNATAQSLGLGDIVAGPHVEFLFSRVISHRPCYGVCPYVEFML